MTATDRGEAVSPGPTFRNRSDALSDAPRLRPPRPLPPGRPLDLPGRGTTFVREVPGPPGAPAVVLLHGWLATADLNWFGAYETLGRSFRVIAVDHRGHGRGLRAPGPFRLEDCADDVAAVAEELDVDRFVPVGYSMGGAVAQLVWHRHRERVAGLVLCATSRNFRGRPADRAAFGLLAGMSVAARLAPETLHRRAHQRLAGQRHPEPTATGRWARAEFDRSDFPTLMEAGRELGRFTSHEWIGGVDVPTAVVLTERDRIVSPERQRKLARAIAGATVHPVDGDHTIVGTEPGPFTPALEQALREVTAER